MADISIEIRCGGPSGSYLALCIDGEAVPNQQSYQLEQSVVDGHACFTCSLLVDGERIRLGERVLPGA